MQPQTDTTAGKFRFINGVLVGIGIGLFLTVLVIAAFGVNLQFLVAGLFNLFEQSFWRRIGIEQLFTAMAGFAWLIASYVVAGKTRSKGVEIVCSVISGLLVVAMGLYVNTYGFLSAVASH